MKRADPIREIPVAARKGKKTRQAILASALDLSSELGLEGVTLGVLAKRVGMSKSGLYAHFESKEDLQCQVLQMAADRFVAAVLLPAIAIERGRPRLRNLFERWLSWTREELSGGCPFVAAATEFDDRPGEVRDTVARHLRELLGMLERAARICVEEGHFREDLDCAQFAYEAWGVLLAHHHFRRLLEAEDADARAEKAYNDLVRLAGVGLGSET